MRDIRGARALGGDGLSVNGPRRRPVRTFTRRAMHYLTACAIYLNEAPYLEEWIEFHRLVGVEKFFLYNHMSDDGHREVLRPYIEEGTVVVRDWPDEPGQVSAYHDCLDRHRHEARWIAFIDLD